MVYDGELLMVKGECEMWLEIRKGECGESVQSGWIVRCRGGGEWVDS